MASHLLKIQPQSTWFPHPSLPFSTSKIPSGFSITKELVPFTTVTRIFDIPFQSSNISYRKNFFHRRSLNISKSPFFSIYSSLSSSSPTPPTSKEDAIFQAKTSLSSTLQKPLNNPKLTGKIKKQKQPRYRVEIPVIDDSPDSLVQLAFDVFGNLQIRRKGTPIKVLLIWPNPNTITSALKAFQGAPFGQFEHIDITTVVTVDNRILNSADVAIFLAPSSSQLTVMKLVGESLNPRPLVLFNPKWQFEEEGSFGDLSGFVSSFDVVYAFVGLEVRGLLSKRKGVVFKCVKDGVVSSERWNVLVEEEGNQLRVVSRFKSRPSITEVENVLYNLMAVNSPITKSAKFLKDLVSIVTGKKAT